MRRAYTKIAQKKKISALDDESDSQCRASSDPGCLANLELHWLNATYCLLNPGLSAKFKALYHYTLMFRIPATEN